MKGFRCSGCRQRFPLPSFAQVGLSQVCSAECATTVRQRSAQKQVSRVQNRAMVNVICEKCGKGFQRRTDQVGRHNGRNFCSRMCANQANASGNSRPARKTGRTISCQKCHKEFYVSGSRLRYGARFCSHQCASAWHLEQPRLKRQFGFPDNAGTKNGRYKNGESVGRSNTTAVKARVRRAVGERDGDWCLLCGKPPKGLHLHRVRYGSEGGAYEITNCVQLCGLHHDIVHSNKRVWQPKLIGYLSESDPGQTEMDALRRWAKPFLEGHRLR